MLNSLKSEPTAPERYKRIDDVLGHAAHRYLGDGHRGVDQHLHDVRLGVDEFGDHGVRAKASVRYPAQWSVKDNPIELGPHLSAVDAAILAVTLGECHLAHTRGLDPEQRRRAWIRSLELRAGDQPLLDLDAFDVEARVIESQADPLSLCGHVTTLACRVGGIRARCAIEHEPGHVRTEPGSFATAEELLGDRDTRYYGNGYKLMRRDIADVRITPREGFALGLVTVEEPADGRLGDGLGAAYGPALRPIDGILVAAQLAQAMLYRLDNLDRGDSNTLWMRRVALTAESPHQPLTNPIATTVSTTDTRVTPIRGYPWRTADLDAQMLGWHGSCTLTHVLPFPTSR
ncbi:MAG: AvrD family protein [Actinoallomurus sp.]